MKLKFSVWGIKSKKHWGWKQCYLSNHLEFLFSNASEVCITANSVQAGHTVMKTKEKEKQFEDYISMQ